MSHCWASSFDYHLNHSLVVFTNVHLIFTLRRMRVGGHVVHIKHLINLLLSFVNWVLGFRIKNYPSFLVASMLGLSCRQFPEDRMIGLNVFFCLNVELQSVRPKDQEQVTHPYVIWASRIIISDSVELCETAVCFLHLKLTGTNVLFPKVHKTPPEVGFESSRSPAKSES